MQEVKFITDESLNWYVTMIKTPFIMNELVIVCNVNLITYIIDHAAFFKCA